MRSASANTTSRGSASRREVVDRAEAFMNAHLAESVLIARVCLAVGVSERSLRNAFYEVRGMSPKRCAIRARLAMVRRELRHAEATRRTVTTIAANYGFYELGRFAGTYRAVFGETPSATLRGDSGQMAVAS